MRAVTKSYGRAGFPRCGPGHRIGNLTVAKPRGAQARPRPISVFSGATKPARFATSPRFRSNRWDAVPAAWDPFTSPRFISEYEGTQDERVSQFFAAAFPQTGWAILNAVGAMHLIAAKGGPLDAVEEPMFSRPERRRMEREGVLRTGLPPVVTKIRVNAQGRLHLQAVDDDEGGVGGARRRAHRVRGHYMRTAKGASWRKAHVRGLGPVNETVRVVDAARDVYSSDKVSDQF